MDRPTWAPEDLNLDRPSPARVYDCLLGGSHTFAADRALAAQLTAAMPDAALIAHANRAFLRRAVGFLIGAGIRQFLDLGCGIPTVANVHTLAHHAAPEARVLYVDIDPVAVAHTQTTLHGSDRAGVIHADLRAPDTILDHPELGNHLDLNRPVAVLVLAVLHLVSDADHPHAVVARLRDRIAAGSYLVATHLTADTRPAELGAVAELAHQAGIAVAARSRGDIQRLFTGLDLVAPGLVWAPQWRPDRPDVFADHPDRSCLLAGAARKPTSDARPGPDPARRAGPAGNTGPGWDRPTHQPGRLSQPGQVSRPRRPATAPSVLRGTP